MENVNKNENPSVWRPYCTFVEVLREKCAKNEVFQGSLRNFFSILIIILDCQTHIIIKQPPDRSLLQPKYIVYGFEKLKDTH